MEMDFIDILIIDDNVVERPASENFEIVLTSSSSLISAGRLTIAPDTAAVIIIDNDGRSAHKEIECVL